MSGSQMIEKNDISRRVDAAEVTPDLFFSETRITSRRLLVSGDSLFSLISSFFSASFMLLPACRGAHPDVVSLVVAPLVSQTVLRPADMLQKRQQPRGILMLNSLSPGLRQRC